MASHKSFTQQRAILRPTKHAAFFADDDDDDDVSFDGSSSVSSLTADTLVLAQFLSSTSPDQFNQPGSSLKANKQRASRLFNRWKKKATPSMPSIQRTSTSSNPGSKANSLRSVASDKKRHIPLPVYTPPVPTPPAMSKKSFTQHHTVSTVSVPSQQFRPVAPPMAKRSQSHAPTTSTPSQKPMVMSVKPSTSSSTSRQRPPHGRSSMVRSVSTTSSRFPLRDSGVYSDASMDKEEDWIPPVPAKSQHRRKRPAVIASDTALQPPPIQSLTPSSSTNNAQADRRRSVHSAKKRSVRHAQIQTDKDEQEGLQQKQQQPMAMCCPRCHHQMKMEPLTDDRQSTVSAASAPSSSFSHGRRTSCPAFLPSGQCIAMVVPSSAMESDLQHDRLLSMIEDLKLQLAQEQASRQQLELSMQRQLTATEKRDLVAREKDRWKEDCHWLNNRLSTLPSSR
ncbi:hypothetical protein DM01DRAFT_1403428 [Hesseltinella vesiculosa]|uniref:Uncharacterized protein n=1 Tax=Hesseltinella vesiculosa TaxID=101127 RepID=A0A1X2GY71_9FUNG|nr:hypothetical protein DM01DRAFT_1403428 [Hesseltinella vesiculosa]